MITLDVSRLSGWDQKKMEAVMGGRLEQAHAMLEAGTGMGSEFTGWLRWPLEHEKEEVERIKQAALRIRSVSKTLVVVGIGGSYLGAKAGVDLLRKGNSGGLRVVFAGNTVSADETAELLERLQEEDFSVNVISKSGTTTEPAVAFRLLRALLEQKYGDGANQRIYVTTDKEKGALRALADEKKWTSFVIPDTIGGRYSVLTAVGLLPMAAAGLDIDQILSGAKEEMKALSKRSMENPAWQYAAARNLLYETGTKIEILACYEPSFRFMGEWWKQLFGESEGKDGVGLFPASVEYTADLHSMGQYVQDGQRILMETVVQFQKNRASLSVPYREDDGDGLNFLAGRTMKDLAEQAAEGTAIAHMDGGVPNLKIKVPARSEGCFGALVYFFQLSCALSGYLMGVNPFDQPGVEAYKRNMFALLGKPGYEDLQAELQSRVHD
ncbi:MAG: glucose-6-phosphate isomerase [Oscillospiraceae bacterium]|jgi:glucose-6-phosphate isomerase